MSRRIQLLILSALAMHAVLNPLAAEALTAGSIAVVKADTLRVRSAPSTSAEIVGKIPMGAEVQIVEAPAEFSPWVRVRIPSGSGTGWVHGDYLVAGGNDANPATVGDRTFARITVWNDDPRQDGKRATPGTPAEAAFYGVHGRFPEGTPFTLLARGETQPMSATAKRTIAIKYQDEIPPWPVTEVELSNSSGQVKDFYLGIVGNSVNCGPIQMKEMSNPEDIRKLDARVTASLPDFERMPYDYPYTGFSVSDMRTSAVSLVIADAPAFLVWYKTPPLAGDSTFLQPTSCHTAVLVWKGPAIWCSPDCGKGVEFFWVDDKYYYVREYECCDNGIEFIEVNEIRLDGKRMVYINNDFAN